MNQLPPLLNYFSATMILFAAIFMIGLHTHFAGLAAARASLDERTRATTPLWVGGFLALWLAIALDAGWWASSPLASTLWQRVLAIVIGFGPMLLALAILSWSPTMRRILDAMKPEWLIGAQSYRVEGLMFFWFLYFGLLPASFAIPAATGDFLTGLAAPFVASLVARRDPRARTIAIAWNIFGILDLIVAPVSAVASQSHIFQLYPLNLVPLFLGPPLGILMHVQSLRALAKTRHEPFENSSSAVRAAAAT